MFFSDSSLSIPSCTQSDLAFLYCPSSFSIKLLGGQHGVVRVSVKPSQFSDCRSRAPAEIRECRH
jgi:hypothetical protein